MAHQSFVTAGVRAKWLVCLCVSGLPGCASSDGSPEPTGRGGSSFGAGGNAPALGGWATGLGGGTVTTTGGAHSLGGANSGGVVASGGTPASTGGTSGPGGTSAGGKSSAGAATRGGAQTGGASLVGSAGGSSAGGSSPGGTTSGGRATGGQIVGGSTVGGKAIGGASTGGSPAFGGAAIGGASIGGAATGGKATGGTNMGGAATGGAATGGSIGSSNLCPAGITQTITVAKDGSGEYTTVQAAVNSIASGSSAHVRIDIKAGTYTEKLTIASRTNLCLVGDGATTTILTYNDSNAGVGSTSGSASVFVSANDFSATQLTFQNGYGAGSQAVALRTTGLRQQFLNVRLVGYQDTLYVHSGTQYFRNCYVQGNTDYVFGGASAILQNCEVKNVQSGSATSAPNTASSTAYGLVFLGCSFTAASGVSNVALARPWGADGAAAFLNSTLGGHISAAGFTAMSGNDPNNARFSEYLSTGTGANASGRSSYQMTASQAANYTIANVFGGAWTPSYSQ